MTDSGTTGGVGSVATVERLGAQADQARRERVLTFLRRYGSLVGLSLLFLAFGVAKPGFLSATNIIAILRQCATATIVALGVSLVIIAKGTDFSVGATASLAGVLCAGLLAGGHGVLAAVAGGLGLGLAVGLANAVVISLLGVSSIVCTFGVLFILRSVELIYTNGGNPVHLFLLPPDKTNAFLVLGQSAFVGIPIPVWVMAISGLLVYFLLERTKFGRYIRAIGGNVKVARLSGIPVELYFGSTYVLAAVLSAWGGIINTARVSSGMPQCGEGFLLDSVSAVLVGTTMFKGGLVNVPGTILGAFFATGLTAGLAAVGVSAIYTYMLKGVLILGAVALGTVIRRSER